MPDVSCSLIAHIKSISKSGWLYLQTLSKIQPLFACTLVLPRSKPPSSLLDCYCGLLAGIFSTSGQSDHVKTKYVHHFSAPNLPLAPCDTQNKSQGTSHFLQSPMWSGLQSPLYYCTHPLHSPHCIHSSHLAPLMSLKCTRHAPTTAFALANSFLEHSPTTPVSHGLLSHLLKVFTWILISAKTPILSKSATPSVASLFYLFIILLRFQY